MTTREDGPASDSRASVGDARVDALDCVERIYERIESDAVLAEIDADLGVSFRDVVRGPLWMSLVAARRGERSGSSSRSLAEEARVIASTARDAVRVGRAPGRDDPKCDVLFVPRRRAHAAVALAVADSLRRDGTRVRVVALRRDLRAMIERAGHLAATPTTWWPLLVADAEARARAYRPALRALRRLRLASFGTLTGAEVVEATIGTFSQQLPAAFTAARTADRLIDAAAPRAVGVGNDLTIEGRAFALVAATKGIATFCPQHGLGTGNPLLAHSVVDRVLTYGAADARALGRMGLAPTRVEVVGAPALRQASRGTSTRHRPDFVPGTRPYILVATSGSGNRVSAAHHRAFIDALQGAARAIADVDVVVKLHPKDAAADYEACRATGAIHVVEGNKSWPSAIEPWLAGAEALVTMGSAAVLDGLLAGVPVITVDLANELDALDFVAARATRHVRTAAELAAALGEVAMRVGLPQADTSEGAARYLEDKVAATGQQAADRAGAAIRTLISVGRSATPPTSVPRRAIPDAPPRPKLRVVVLGDSLALPRHEGKDVVRFDETWPQALAARAAPMGASLEVVNVSTRARTAESLVGGDFDEHVVLKEADVVVVEVGIVDCAPRALTRRQKRLLQHRLVPHALRANVLRVLSDRRRRIGAAGVVGDVYTTPAAYKAYLEGFLRRLSRDAAETRSYFVPIVGNVEVLASRSPMFAAQIAAYNELLDDVAGSAVIALPTLCAADFCADGYHLSARGSRVVADAVHARLVSDGLVSRPGRGAGTAGPS